MKISGNIVDISKREIYPGVLHFYDGIVEKLEKSNDRFDHYILPGLIDAHIHIESSMVTPGSFACAAVPRGTTAVVSDPHEIANVLGIEGVNFMIKDASKVPLKFFFGAPSCVPATSFERSGAVLGAGEVESLLRKPEIKYLSEMMNFPGVIYGDEAVNKKILSAKKSGKPVDGHAPGLRGDQLRKYVNAGISTDHECSTIEEAREKISLGMKVIIREGSAARNLDSLKELYRESPGMIMLCSDDLHPEMLAEGHINKLVSRLVNEGYDLFDVLASCSVNPAMHYGLPTGWLQAGQPADFIIVDHYKKMNVIETWINGERVYTAGTLRFDYDEPNPVNKFNCSPIKEENIRVIGKAGLMRVIGAIDHELLTKELTVPSAGGETHSDTGKDILKIVVKDRYNDSPPSTAFIKGFGLKRGAFASSVAHDSHNIICAGADDSDMVAAINEVVRLKGGLAVSEHGKISSLQLKIAGIMSDRPVDEVAASYQSLEQIVKSLGCMLSSPFMTLSFMALLVIPELKLSDSGLFDGRSFKHVSLFV
jgi:adenine deaminase